MIVTVYCALLGLDDELDDELEEDDTALSVVADSLTAAGVTATGLGFSGK